MISSGVGTIYSSSGQFEKAEDYYREATQLEPWNIAWKNEFAWFLIDNDINVEEGLKIADEALEIDPEYWPAIDSKGWAFYKLGKYEEALKLLKDSWDLKFAYSHNGYLHIQEIEQALAKTKSEVQPGS